MKLTGKAKEDFEKWYLKEYRDAWGMELLWFDTTPFSMQYGVYVDFFDFNNIWIQNGIIIANNKFYYYGGNTRTEARQKAIEKANEIYNNKL